MSIWNLELKEHIMPETDLYHPNNPFHHLVIGEIEEYEEAMEAAYKEETARLAAGQKRQRCGQCDCRIED